MQVKAQFHFRQITSEERRYLHTVSSSSADVTEKLADILSTPDSVNPFNHLKAAVLDRKSESARSRLQKHLTVRLNSSNECAS